MQLTVLKRQLLDCGDVTKLAGISQSTDALSVAWSKHAAEAPQARDRERRTAPCPPSRDGLDQIGYRNKAKTIIWSMVGSGSSHIRRSAGDDKTECTRYFRLSLMRHSCSESRLRQSHGLAAFRPNRSSNLITFLERYMVGPMWPRFALKPRFMNQLMPEAKNKNRGARLLELKANM